MRYLWFMIKVLFVCEHNSIRSKIAEAFANYFGEGRVEAHSAGLKPKREANPKMILMMREIGIKIKNARTRGVQEFKDHHFDYIITLGNVEVTDITHQHSINWPIPNIRFTKPMEFRKSRNQIGLKVREWIESI